MDMTFEQYIINPMGKNNAVLSANVREVTRLTYSKKFDNLMLREHGKVEYHLYTDQPNNTYWIHAKIPSETVKDFYYDVIVKFYTNQQVESGGKDLFKYFVKFYSNDPAFVYTYAHTFIKNELFVKELISKMSKEAIQKPAKEKNAGDNIGYVKTIYFLYLLMKNRGLNKTIRFEGEAKSLDLLEILKNVEDADDKINKRQEEGAKVSKRKKITLDKQTTKNISKYFNQDTNTDRLRVTTTKSAGKIQNKVSKNIKSTKRSGSVKRK